MSEVATQTEIVYSEKLDQLAAALAAFQSEVPAIAKTANNPFFKSRYADLADVKAAADPIATKNGLAVTQFPGRDRERGEDTLTTWLLHKSGQFIRETMSLHLSKGPSEAQAHGSALTYARRYCYMSVLGLVADEDDDANKTRAQPQQQQRPAQAKQQQRQAPAKEQAPQVQVSQQVLDMREKARDAVNNAEGEVQTELVAWIAEKKYPKPSELSVPQAKDIIKKRDELVQAKQKQATPA